MKYQNVQIPELWLSQHATSRLYAHQKMTGIVSERVFLSGNLRISENTKNLCKSLHSGQALTGILDKILVCELGVKVHMTCDSS